MLQVKETEKDGDSAKVTDTNPVLVWKTGREKVT